MLPLARRALRAVLTTALVLAALAVGTGAVLARLDHVRFATVLSGSMAPAIGVGDVVAGTPVDADDVAVGDVVLFVPPAPWTTPGGRPVVHRVDSVEVDDGVLELRTRGDDNPEADPWTLDARRTTLFALRGQSAVLGDVVRLGPAAVAPLLWTVPVLALGAHLLRRIWWPRPAAAHAR